MSQFPARLHVLMAARAPLGVVLRRGPTNAVCSLRWDRANDSFQIGQWVRHRIYERRSDISPDGRYLIYFARNSAWQSETKGTWTAVSRAPWLKAVVLFGKGDCWNGGGMFTSERRYWLNAGCGHFLIRDSGEVEQDQVFKPTGSYGGECPSVYYRRLQRDGWVLEDKLDAELGSAFTIFEKALPHGWTLRKYARAEVGPHPPGHGCYWDEHEIEQRELGQRLQRPNWEWAELDGETLVWAERGCLYRAPVGREEMGEARLLFDFNGMEFEPIEAPY